MGVLSVAEEEDDDQQDGSDGQTREDEGRGVVMLIVDAHEGDHVQDTGESPAGLAADDRVRGVEALLCHDGRSGEDHGEAHDHEGKSGEEDPFVYADALGQLIDTL